MVERSNFITRFLDRIDAPLPESPAVVEAQRIMDEKQLLKRQTDNFSRKDIPKVLEILSQNVVERSPNQVSAVVAGEKISIEGIDGGEKDALKININGKKSIVHNPHLVGDILKRKK